MSISALSSQGFLYARANAVSRNKIASNIITLPVAAISNENNAPLNKFPQKAANTTQKASPVPQLPSNPSTQKLGAYQEYQAGVASQLEIDRHHPKAQIAISNYKTNENFNKLQEIQEMLGVNLYV